ncbi:hypothetical protein TRIUR3_07804 [Triticum urartu]|uniref:Uncharacterized protein n=1 Tax=Triticum urartu TaxID=4572 RepID=M8A8L9_TRIUA|nr:hypothetical protein TRIUR3_07804 [Triticum urartu]
MDRLKRLCKVLGSNYQERLDKLGIAAGQKEMDEKTSKDLEQTIRVLEKAKEARFSKILVQLWTMENLTALPSFALWIDGLMCRIVRIQQQQQQQSL